MSDVILEEDPGFTPLTADIPPENPDSPPPEGEPAVESRSTENPSIIRLTKQPRFNLITWLGLEDSAKIELEYVVIVRNEAEELYLGYATRAPLNRNISKQKTCFHWIQVFSILRILDSYFLELTIHS